ncbi:hypothetical protein QI633_08210 [Nocardioides sp. QY071]|nr:hypothetical protein [Nocardioides sp. QY071]WGY03736.1 hypothetical protein QI633_08210 [Nocardioides sp. QY071]
MILDADYFARLVEPAPDFSPEQLEQLRRILGGPIDESSEDSVGGQ